MKFLFIIIITFFMHPSVNPGKGDKEGWILEKEKNSIKIWSHKTDAMRFKSLRAMTTYHASVKQMAAILNDAASYPNWMVDMESMEILKEVSPNERYFYFVVDAPWPISNRDNIVHFKLTEDTATGGFKAVMEGMANYLPEQPGIVRVVKSQGSWQVRPKGNNEIEPIFEYAADSGEKIPACTVNIFIVDDPIKTLINLREHLKYKDINNN